MACYSTPKVMITSVYDGDTARAGDERVRLKCIDAPELRSTRTKKKEPVKARAFRDFLRGLILGKEVVINRKTTDRYGRTVAELEIEGENINEKMWRDGYAEVDPRYASQCEWSVELDEVTSPQKKPGLLPASGSLN